MYTLTVFSLGITLLTAPFTLSTRPAVDQPQDSANLRGELADVVASAAEDELIPVTIIMRDQAAPEDIQRAVGLRDRDARRAAVKRILKSVADESQKGLLEVLRAGKETGAVGPDVRTLWIHNVVVADVTARMALQIAVRADVAYLNHDRKIADAFPAERGNPPGNMPRAIECGVDLMEAPRVWDELGITGRDVIVAVIDTGCCITHPDLEHQIWTNPGEIPDNDIDDDDNGFVDDIVGWNFQDNNNDVTDVHFWGHGTHVSGTVAGDGTNGETTGMAPDCAVMTCKFWNDWAGESTVWQSMQYAADNGAHVISASLGWIASVNPDRSTWRAICENTIAMGLVVIYAAGNEDSHYPPYNSIRTPGDVPDVITVGATDCFDNVWSDSSRGPVTWQTVPPYYDWPYPPGKIKPSICAPGVDTLSTSNDCTGYATLSGTSMATPHVSGTVALMLEANPGLDHFAVKDILMSTALDLGDPGFDNESGMGRVNAFEAVLAALEPTCPGDLDGDNDIDLSDLSQLLAHYGTTSGAEYEDGDIDGDGDVDLSDLSALLSVYGDVCS